MIDLDNDLILSNGIDEDELFMSNVICNDCELLYLDTYLKEIFAK